MKNRFSPSLRKCWSQTRVVATAANTLCTLLFAFAVFASDGSIGIAVAQQADTPPTAAYGCSGVYHLVRVGETIGTIARRYGSSAYRIAACNGLSSYTVYVGQTLLVPTGGRRGAWQAPPLPINRMK